MNVEQAMNHYLTPAINLREGAQRMNVKLNELLGVVEQICIDDIKSAPEYYDEYYLQRGDATCAQIGALTVQVSRHSRFTTQATRYRLKKLLAAGKLIEKKTAGGITRWWPVGLAEKLTT